MRGPALALLTLGALGLTVAPGIAERPLVVGMGDSVGEAVLSAEASSRTQRSSFIYVVAQQMGAEMPLPLIQSWPLGTIYEVSHRRRRADPWVEGLNLAVSGANVRDVLRTRANAATPEEIDSETDLILFPRRASQIEIVEALQPEFVVCWIGGNDVLSTATSYDQLDASQMTSVASFTASFHELASRLQATGANVVFGNVPDVTSIPFLMDGEQLLRFTGEDFGLPAGSYTTLPAMIALRLGLANEKLLDNPSFVLDAAEVERIQERVADFNDIIATESERIGAALVDMNRLMGSFTGRTIDVLGVPLGNEYLGGIFSLDGVHPGPLAHRAIALAFLAKMNQSFGTSFPLPSPVRLYGALRVNPYADRDGDLRAPGLPLNGALETFGPLIGISGDLNDLWATPRARTDPERGRQFMRAFRRRQGVASSELDAWTFEDAVEALRRLFALPSRSR